MSVPWLFTEPTVWVKVLKKSRPPEVSVRVLSAAMSTTLAATLPMRRLFRVVSTATVTAPVTAVLMLILSVGAARAMVLVAEVRLE